MALQLISTQPNTTLGYVQDVGFVETLVCGVIDNLQQPTTAYVGAALQYTFPNLILVQTC